MGDGFGQTQPRKSNSTKDAVGDVHGIFGENQNSVEPSDQPHSGVTVGENQQLSNLKFPSLVEDFPRDAQSGAISNFDLADPIQDQEFLSPTNSQILNFN